MNSNHPALISGGLFFVIGLALAAALFTGLLPHCWHNGPSVCYWMTRAAGGASAVVAFLGLAMMFSRSAGAGFGMAVGVFLNAILIAGVAGPLIGPCPMPASRLAVTIALEKSRNVKTAAISPSNIERSGRCVTFAAAMVNVVSGLYSPAAFAG